MKKQPSINELEDVIHALLNGCELTKRQHAIVLEIHKKNNDHNGAGYY